MKKDSLKICTIGGGSSYTPEIIEGMIERKKKGELPIREVWLLDIDEGKEKLEIVGNLAKRMVKEAGVDIEIHLTLDRKEALKDADFVTTQFRVGLLDARIRDERIPLKYGILGQETNGAGGFAKAQRTIPVILDICKDMKELCPDAWLINFTNPSGMVTEAVIKYTDRKVIGVCNVPYFTKTAIAEVLGEDREDVDLRFVGLNHFLFAREIYVKGEDKTSEALEILKGGIEGVKNIPEELKFPKEVINSTKSYPVDYLKYYFMKRKSFEDFEEKAEKEGTRGEVCKRIEAKLFELYKDMNLNEKPKELNERGGAYYSTVALNVMDAIYNNRANIHVVSTRNNGTIPELPDDVVVECNCVIDSSGARPMTVGRLHPMIRGMIQLQKAFEELTIEAAVTGDYNTAVAALTINPLVNDVEVAKAVLNDIIKENKKYLPQYE